MSGLRLSTCELQRRHQRQGTTTATNDDAPTDVIMRPRRDVGETLIEVLFTIVIVGLTFSALFSSLATTGSAGNVQRISVQADVVLRNYAEAVKANVQLCSTATPTFVVPPLTSVQSSGTFTIVLTDEGTKAALVGAAPCPVIDSVTGAGSTLLLTIAVRGPLLFASSMKIRVITP